MKECDEDIQEIAESEEKKGIKNSNLDIELLDENSFISSVKSNFSISSINSSENEDDDLLFFKCHHYFDRYINMEQIIPFIHKATYKKGYKVPFKVNTIHLLKEGQIKSQTFNYLYNSGELLFPDKNNYISICDSTIYEFHMDNIETSDIYNDLNKTIIFSNYFNIHRYPKILSTITQTSSVEDIKISLSSILDINDLSRNKINKLFKYIIIKTQCLGLSLTFKSGITLKQYNNNVQFPLEYYSSNLWEIQNESRYFVDGVYVTTYPILNSENKVVALYQNFAGETFNYNNINSYLVEYLTERIDELSNEIEKANNSENLIINIGEVLIYHPESKVIRIKAIIINNDHTILTEKAKQIINDSKYHKKCLNFGPIKNIPQNSKIKIIIRSNKTKYYAVCPIQNGPKVINIAKNENDLSNIELTPYLSKGRIGITIEPFNENLFKHINVNNNVDNILDYLDNAESVNNDIIEDLLLECNKNKDFAISLYKKISKKANDIIDHPKLIYYKDILSFMFYEYLRN